MAKNFGKAASTKAFKEVAKQSAEQAQVITVQMISDENMIDYPKNNEDIEDTADIENSIKELGFIDPLEVTSYGMEENKYMIVSGHRRRMAGRRRGIRVFPCIIKHFSNENDMQNYVLLANSQRDSSKDPLLFCKRYKMHEQYLRESDFKGSVREEIAKRLGISTQQADRYNQFNKIILPIWDMVRANIVGMSSVLGMAQHEIPEQEGILQIFNECLEQGNRLIRETCEKIIKGYRLGNRSWNEIINPVKGEQVKQSPKIDSFENLEQISFQDSNTDIQNHKDSYTDSQDYQVSNTDNQNHKDSNTDSQDYQISNTDNQNHKDSYTDSQDYQISNTDNQDHKDSYTDNQNHQNSNTNNQNHKDNNTDNIYNPRIKNGENINKVLARLENALNEDYAFENDEKAQAFMRTINSTLQIALEELEGIGRNYNQKDLTIEIMNELDRIVKHCLSSLQK